MHNVLREESAQSTVEYAIVTVALLSIVLAIAGALARWHRWALGGTGRAGSVSWRRPIVGYRCRDGCQGTSLCIDIACEDRAQSTVEAAFLLPTFFDAYLARVAAGVPALYACGHGVRCRRDRAAHDHDDGGGRR